MKAEEFVLSRSESITFRLATVFGMSPRMRVDLLVNDFVHRAVNDRTLVIFEGHFKRNYIHIQDVARVFLHGLENFESMKGRPYNGVWKMQIFQKLNLLPLFNDTFQSLSSWKLLLVKIQTNEITLFPMLDWKVQDSNLNTVSMRDH